jgi:hypothetical protein
MTDGRGAGSGPGETNAAAYGWRVRGLVADGSLALYGSGSWPAVSVMWRVADHPGPESEAVVDDRMASIRVPGGWLSVQRERKLVTIFAEREPEDADMVHPYLWPAAAVLSRWAGWETLHAGAIVLPGSPEAWVVLGASGNGKSSLLASFALAGCTVAVDDLVVIDGTDCYAGPRCIDLKPDAARALDLEPETTTVRATSRRRLSLPPCAGRMPIRGFVQLAWAEEISIDRQPPSASFATLAKHRRVTVLGAEMDQLLELAGLPMLTFARPRRWEAVPDAQARLLDALSTGDF